MCQVCWHRFHLFSGFPTSGGERPTTYRPLSHAICLPTTVTLIWSSAQNDSLKICVYCCRLVTKLEHVKVELSFSWVTSSGFRLCSSTITGIKKQRNNDNCRAIISYLRILYQSCLIIQSRQLMYRDLLKLGMANLLSKIDIRFTVSIHTGLFWKHFWLSRDMTTSLHQSLARDRTTAYDTI
jgi:hypothetical protein